MKTGVIEAPKRDTDQAALRRGIEAKEDGVPKRHGISRHLLVGIVLMSALCSFPRTGLGGETGSGGGEVKERLDSLRKSGDFAQAVTVAEQVLDTTRQDSLAMPYEIADAERILASTRRAAALPADQQQELAAFFSRDAQIEKLNEDQDYEALYELYRRDAETLWHLLGPNDPFTAQAMANLGVIANGLGHLEEAEGHLRLSLDLRFRIFEEPNPQLVDGLHNLAMLLVAREAMAEAEVLARKALTTTIAAYGGDHPAAINPMDILAKILMDRGNYVEAERILRESLALCRSAYGDRNPEVAIALLNLAQALAARGAVAEAESTLRAAIAMDRETGGGNEIAMAGQLVGLATLAWAREDTLDARVLLRDASLLAEANPTDSGALISQVHEMNAAISRHASAPTPPASPAAVFKPSREEMEESLAAMRRVGLYAEAAGVADEFVSELQEDPTAKPYEIVSARLLADAMHRASGLTMEEREDLSGADRLANLLSDTSMQLGLDAARHVADTYERLLGAENLDHASALETVGEMAGQQREFAEGTEALTRSLSIRRAELGNDHPDVARSLSALGTIRSLEGKPAEAAALHREALAIQRKALGESDAMVAGTLNNLAEALRAQGRAADAEAAYREALSIMNAAPDGAPWVPGITWNLAEHLFQQGRRDEAIALYRKAIKLYQEGLGEGHEMVAFHQAMLESRLREASPDSLGAEDPHEAKAP